MKWEFCGYDFGQESDRKCQCQSLFFCLLEMQKKWLKSYIYNQTKRPTILWMQMLYCCRKKVQVLENIQKKPLRMCLEYIHRLSTTTTPRSFCIRWRLHTYHHTQQSWSLSPKDQRTHSQAKPHSWWVGFTLVGQLCSRYYSGDIPVLFLLLQVLPHKSRWWFMV